MNASELSRQFSTLIVGVLVRILLRNSRTFSIVSSMAVIISGSYDHSRLDPLNLRAYRNSP